MTLPANLFVDTPEMEDVSLHQLGNDVESWPEEIVQKVKERLPASVGLNLVVKFMKKDEENGVATGSVTVHSTDKVAVIPVIVKDFMMYPLDVFIAGGKLLPLTPDYFNAVFTNTQIFQKIEEYPTFGGLGRFEDANLWNAIYPPSLGRYAYASAGYPICDALMDTVDGTELKKFLADARNEKVAARLLSGPHKELVTKLANLKPVNMNEFRQGADNLIPRSIRMLRYEGPNKYTLLSNSDEVFHPDIGEPMTRNDCYGMVRKISDHAEDDINDVDQNGEKMLTVPEPHDPVFLAGAPTEHIEDAHEYDHYVVKTKTGVEVEGVVVPKVIDFDQKFQDLKVFIGKTYSSIQPEIAGVRIKNSRFKPKMSAPKLGQTGVFFFKPDDSHALCTVPVTIEAITDDGGMTLKVADMMGRPLRLTLSGYGSLQRIAKLGTGHYSIPKEMHWVALEPMTVITSSAIDYAAKTASERITNRPVFLIPTGYGQYSMKGVDKYAKACGWDHTNLQGYQAKFLLASLGASEQKIAQAVKIASVKGRAQFHGLRQPPLLGEKIASKRPLAEKLAAHVGKFKVNLVKEASYLENSQTVDALLSLNFVSPQNITKYVGKLPALKAAVSHLASCLLASRLGMKEIPEQSTSTAMNRLVEVITGLERLRATQEVAAAPM